jgi:hypothetical protein
MNQKGHGFKFTGLFKTAIAMMFILVGSTNIVLAEQLPNGNFELIMRAGSCPLAVSVEGQNLLRSSDDLVWTSFGDFNSCPHAPTINSNCMRGPRYGCSHDFCFALSTEQRAVSFTANRIEVEIVKHPGGAKNTTRCLFQRVRSEI